MNLIVRFLLISNSAFLGASAAFGSIVITCIDSAPTTTTQLAALVSCPGSVSGVGYGYARFQWDLNSSGLNAESTFNAIAEAGINGFFPTLPDFPSFTNQGGSVRFALTTVGPVRPGTITFSGGGSREFASTSFQIRDAGGSLLVSCPAAAVASCFPPATMPFTLGQDFFVHLSAFASFGCSADCIRGGGASGVAQFYLSDGTNNVPVLLAVPEARSAALVVLGLLAIGRIRRRR